VDDGQRTKLFLKTIRVYIYIYITLLKTNCNYFYCIVVVRAIFVHDIHTQRYARRGNVRAVRMKISRAISVHAALCTFDIRTTFRRNNIKEISNERHTVKYNHNIVIIFCVSLDPAITISDFTLLYRVVHTHCNTYTTYRVIIYIYVQIDNERFDVRESLA